MVDVTEYARARDRLFIEREGVQRASRDPFLRDVAEAAGILKIPVARLRELAADHRMPGVRRNGELIGIDERDLGIYARANAAELVELT